MSETDNSAAGKAAAFVDWWAMAGVDYVAGEKPKDWLEAETPSDAGKPESSDPAARPAPPPVSARPSASPPPAEQTAAQAAIAQEQWPKSLEELKQMLADGAALPGNSFGGKTALPAGPANAPLMIVSDLPDVEEIEAGILGQSANGRLLANMVKAMGHRLEDCYLTALANTRPASGDLPDGSAKELAAFILHQTDIAKPQRLLILGSAACSALLDAELMTARGNLHYIKHNVQKMTAVTTFHPRTLMARPVLKAQAWEDLQMLMTKDIS